MKNCQTIMAKKPFSTSRLSKILIGKPTLLTLNSSILLSSLIGPQFWLLFDLSGLEILLRHQTAKDFVIQLEVTNDCAERGTKLIFYDCAQNEEQLRLLLQVVEQHRK